MRIAECGWSNEEQAVFRSTRNPHSTIRNLFRRTLQKGLWKLGFHRALPDRPSTLMVEPTNVCNLHCPACPTGAGILNRPPRAMSFDEFRNILDQALDPPGYLRRVTLFNYGEPFLCKDLLRMVRCAADRGLETFTSTNGQFFGEEKIAGEVVASGLTELLVCLDGADQETISRYRKDANFDEILSGIRRILAARALRRSSGQAAPIVELQFIVMKHNESQVERMRRIAADLGVDRFIVKTVGISPAMPGFERLAEELLPANLADSRYERRADGTFALKGEPGCGCEYVFSTLVVNSNGAVVPCCYDIHSEHVMGNLFRQPLAEIWLGEKFRDFRRRVGERRDAVPICRHCPEGRVAIRKEEKVSP
jgi:radical SAM protein with 4Fe4S-binding SPASM domain